MTTFRNWVFLGLLVCAASACDLNAQTSPPSNLDAYDVPVITEAEFASLAKTACEKAAGKKKVLLEFSAPWCGDCKGLHAMKQVGSLKKELAEWEVLVLNIGKFEHHDALLKHFKLKAIADWRVLDPPKDCSQPLISWPVVSQRTLEPLSGKPVSVSALSSWLKTIRSKK